MLTCQADLATEPDQPTPSATTDGGDQSLTSTISPTGPCMCPVDLKRSLGENTHAFVVGPATFKGYRLGFRYYSAKRQCGALDVLPDPSGEVHGVLSVYPGDWAITWNSGRRSSRRVPPRILCRETGWTVLVGVQDYVVVQKTTVGDAPNDWYFNVVLRGDLLQAARALLLAPF